MAKLHAINLYTEREHIIYRKDAELIYYARIHACDDKLVSYVSIYRAFNHYFVMENRFNNFTVDTKDSLYQYNTLKAAWAQKRNAFRRLRKYSDFKIDKEESYDNYDFSNLR